MSPSRYRRHRTHRRRWRSLRQSGRPPGRPGPCSLVPPSPVLGHRAVPAGPGPARLAVLEAMAGRRSGKTGPGSRPERPAGQKCRDGRLSGPAAGLLKEEPCVIKEKLAQLPSPPDAVPGVVPGGRSGEPLQIPSDVAPQSTPVTPQKAPARPGSMPSCWNRALSSCWPGSRRACPWDPASSSPAAMC